MMSHSCSNSAVTADVRGLTPRPDHLTTPHSAVQSLSFSNCYERVLTAPFCNNGILTYIQYVVARRP